MSNSDPTLFERRAKGGTGWTGLVCWSNSPRKIKRSWSRFSCYWPPAIRPPSLKPYEARCEPGNAPHGSSTTKKPSLSANKLYRLLDSVEEELLALDTALALGLLEEFLQSDRWILERVDDSAGCIGTAYRRACQLFARAAAGVASPAALAERIALLVERTTTGCATACWSTSPNF